MVLGVEHNMRIQTVRAFRCAPGFSEQSVNVGPEHCAGMVQAEERIEAHLFELSLPRAGSALPLMAQME